MSGIWIGVAGIRLHDLAVDRDPSRMRQSKPAARIRRPHCGHLAETTACDSLPGRALIHQSAPPLWKSGAVARWASSL